MIEIQNIFQLLYEKPFLLLLLLLFVVLCHYLVNSYVLRRQLPAGPTGLPIVGYQPFLGKEKHKTIAKLSEKYGNVFTLKLGVNYVVILNDFDAVKDAFNKDSLLGRPIEHYQYLATGLPSLIDDSRQVWREHRRFSVQLMKDLGSGKGSMEDKIAHEIDYLIKRIDKNNGQPINIKAILTQSTANNVSHLVFGHRLDEEDRRWKTFFENAEKGMPLMSPTGFFATAPVWLIKLIFKLARASSNVIETIFKIFEEEVSEHLKTFNENNIRDYIDGYLAEMKTRKRNDLNTSFTMEKLNANLITFFGAGSDTVRTATNWVILLAVKYPDYQHRVQTEIDSVVGSHRAVTCADKVMMPVIITQAFISEVLRLKPPAPFNLYRRALEDTHILNHSIQKDTLVLANFWAVHNDSKLWDNPDQFNPDRFLSKDGKQLIKTEYLIPFSIGKRDCPGEALARMEIFLYFASLLQRKMSKLRSFGHIFYLSMAQSEDIFQVFTKYPELLLNEKAFIGISLKHWLALNDNIFEKVFNLITNQLTDFHSIEINY